MRSHLALLRLVVLMCYSRCDSLSGSMRFARTVLYARMLHSRCPTNVSGAGGSYRSGSQNM
eukprot:9492132-Pyramimonas_sp.AAC.1